MNLPKYYLEKPNLALDCEKMITKANLLDEKFITIFAKANSPEYLYWDKLKYKITNPSLTPEESWNLIRRLRNITAQETFIKADPPYRTLTDVFFKWIRLPYTDEYLHKIDMYAGGKIFPKPLSSSQKNDLVVHGIIEEAIASSQLEGAHTTRAAAKKMLLEKRRPMNNSEQMIVNNYKAMTSIEAEYSKSNLSLDMMFSLHKELTHGTEIDKNAVGRLRKDTDSVVVQGQIGGTEYITHKPPPEKFLKKEIARLIAFANDTEGDRFIHPVIKAIFLHFWIGYLHPFSDGNGRIARALFYWYLLKKGYWTMMYIPISTVIKHAPIQYAMAYIYTEQDNFDLTYFYDFHIKKIIQALEAFEFYIEKKAKENRKLDDILGKQMALNERQKQLIHHFISDNTAGVTVTSHSAIHNISRQTAAKDLRELENKQYITSRREGKFIRYYPSEKFIDLKKEI